MADASKSKPKVVFVLGGPGSGKGTQCSKIEEKYKFNHISAGDCLREERNDKDSEYGSLIDKHIKEGTIVPVEITVKLLLNKMRKLGWEGGKFLIDGFPRNLDNYAGWIKCTVSEGGEGGGGEDNGDGIVQVVRCIVFECNEEEMERRLIERGRTSGRIDDNIESIKKRFNTYVNETKCIIDIYEKKGIKISIDSGKDIESVWRDVQGVFDQLDV